MSNLIFGYPFGIHSWFLLIKHEAKFKAPIQ